MHLKEMSHWLWTCGAWERVKFGSMGRALEDIGWLTQKVTAMFVATLEHTDPQSVSMVAVIQPKDGNKLTSQHQPLVFRSNPPK